MTFLKTFLKSEQTICCHNYKLSITIVFVLLFIIVTTVYFILPERREHSNAAFRTSEIEECLEKSTVHSEFTIDPEDNFKLRSYVPKLDSMDIITNFLPDTNEIAVFEDPIRYDEFPEVPLNSKYKNKVTEQEALTSVQMALKMKDSLKLVKAKKLFQHAMALQPLHPEVLNHYAEFLEVNENDIITADHLYVRALVVCPQHIRATMNRNRTMPVVEMMDQQDLERINRKRFDLVKINHNNPTLKRLKKEVYFLHIYHTLAIEGNTMSLAETRTVVETGMAVPGKSILEHNEILGLESALLYMNKTFVHSPGSITVVDILQIHKRVLGRVDPVVAGTFRRDQVFVGEHVPPAASDVEYLMEQFVDWLRSERLHPVKKAALAHYKFAYIHPFVDGNGRTARLIMNLLLMKEGYPPVIIRKQDRAMYYNTLQMANEGDVRPFVRFIVHCAECTLNVFLNASDCDLTYLKALEPKLPSRSDVISL